MRRNVRGYVFSAVTAAALLGVAACGESSTAPGGEQEVISRVTLTLSPVGFTAPVQTVFIDDPDGAGPQSPSAQVGTLSLVRGSSYTGIVKFENRLVNPPEDITEEVEEESNEHRVIYTVTGAGLVISTTDVDEQGRPLGIRFNAAAGTTAGNGAVRVVLCHYGESPKPATATSCTVDTDIDVAFNFSIIN
jgi:hypothetical protein